jgi:hypothetical protein
MPRPRNSTECVEDYKTEISGCGPKGCRAIEEKRRKRRKCIPID